MNPFPTAPRYPNLKLTRIQFYQYLFLTPCGVLSMYDEQMAGDRSWWLISVQAGSGCDRKNVRHQHGGGGTDFSSKHGYEKAFAEVVFICYSRLTYTKYINNSGARRALRISTLLRVLQRAMKISGVLIPALACLAAASGPSQEKRQLTGLLASLEGILGVDQTFDYIVVGGGTGGLTMAKRLAEDPSVTVAVIEAGTVYQVADPIFAETPGGDTTFIGTDETMPTVDWGFFTAPDPASDNLKRSYARGKCLGGRYARWKCCRVSC
jgi:hypothetical protein